MIEHLGIKNVFYLDEQYAFGVYYDCFQNVIFEIGAKSYEQIMEPRLSTEISFGPEPKFYYHEFPDGIVCTNDKNQKFWGQFIGIV